MKCSKNSLQNDLLLVQEVQFLFLPEFLEGQVDLVHPVITNMLTHK